MARLNDTFEYEFYFGASAATKAQAAELRKNMTMAEKILWQKLRNRQICGLKFRRQHPAHIFILDFYCHEKRVAIEVDGNVHLSPEQKEWDENRTFELNEFGITVLRFSNEEVINKIETVVNSVKKFITTGKNPISGPSPSGEGS